MSYARTCGQAATRSVPGRRPRSRAGFGRPKGDRLSGAGCGAAWLARLLWEQEAAGSNPAIPTTSEHMSILVTLVVGAKLGAMCYGAVRG